MTDDPPRESHERRSESRILTSRRRRDRRGPGRALVVAALAVAIVGAGVWWALSRAPGGAPGPADRGAITGEDEVMVGDTTGLASPSVVSGAPFPELPPLEESDAWLRERAADLSPNPRWREWLGADGLVRRLVLAVTNVAAGESPSEPLPFLQPSDTFTVVVEGGRTYLDPASWRRYDALVGAIISLDARATARFYRGVGPLIEAAWRPLGFVERDFDAAAREAVAVVLAAEVPDGRIELVRDGAVWAYADPDLEALPPATKHLLRVGPDNLLRLQDWVRTFAAASGIAR